MTVVPDKTRESRKRKFQEELYLPIYSNSLILKEILYNKKLECNVRNDKMFGLVFLIELVTFNSVYQFCVIIGYKML